MTFKLQRKKISKNDQQFVQAMPAKTIRLRIIGEQNISKVLCHPKITYITFMLERCRAHTLTKVPIFSLWDNLILYS